MKANKLSQYLEDPFLLELMTSIKTAGTIKSSLLDITHKCNLRCVGCYYFTEKMDAHGKVDSEAEFDRFIESEKARGINFFTIVGGEPALELERLKKLAKNFRIGVGTNGTIHIPYEGLENIRLSVSFWGDETQDKILRGNGKRDIFSKALSLYKNDPRVVFYYTTLPGYTDQIEACTDKIIENGNFVSYNFYGDLTNKGGAYSHTQGFDAVMKVINKMTEKYPNRVLSSRHINETISARHLFGTKWGFDVCPSVTFDHPENLDRMKNGKSYPAQFRAYNADLQTTRRCCVGQARDCETCTDLWATYGWIMGSMKAHLGSKEDFSKWLFTTYIFYTSAGFIDLKISQMNLPELYRRYRDEIYDENRLAISPAVEIYV